MTALRAAVLGQPIGHSLSPVIHNAGYAAAGLTDWSFVALECAESELPERVAGLDATWAGLALTMPLKVVALAVAEDASPVVTAIGAANTLVRRTGGSWYAENTDAPGMVDALADAGIGGADAVAILGAGGTARAALAAAAQMRAGPVDVYARRLEAGEALKPIAAALGARLSVRPWSSAPAALSAPLVISTVPARVADGLAGQAAWGSGTVLFDVLYDPWPTPLAASAIAAGVPVVTGLDLLLAQAVRQFELFTGIHPAPIDAMRAALLAARG